MNFVDPFGLEIYKYPGNIYRQFPTPGKMGCKNPVWIGGTITGWKPCNGDEQNRASPPSEDACEDEENSAPPEQPKPELPPFDYEEYMGGVEQRFTGYEEDVDRRRRECFKKAIYGEIFTQSLGKMGVTAGAASKVPFWQHCWDEICSRVRLG